MKKFIDKLHKILINDSRVLVLTGAGVSTDSGLPDYRSPQGAFSKGHQPMTYQRFSSSLRERQKYWARSFAFWRFHAPSQRPNVTHSVLADLQSRGHVDWLITQNVDSLHVRTGSPAIELHGRLRLVQCLSCKRKISRDLYQAQLLEANPYLIELTASHADESKQRPDGDMVLDERVYAHLRVPMCAVCTDDGALEPLHGSSPVDENSRNRVGVMKPDVVFFGENVPRLRSERALAAANTADALVVLGTTLHTFSALRLVRAAHRNGATIVVLNDGATRIDSGADRIEPHLRSHGRCAPVFEEIGARLRADGVVVRDDTLVEGNNYRNTLQ